MIMEAELYTDKDVLECEVHEQSAFEVKDICVDEINNEMVTMKDYYQEPSNDHMNIEDNHDETTSVASSKTQEVDADLPVNEAINDHGNISSKSIIYSQITVEDLQNSIPDNNNKECGSKEEVISNDLNMSVQSGDQQSYQSPEEKISKTSVENKTTTDGDTTLNLANTEPETISGDRHNVNLERDNQLSVESHTEPRLQDAGTVNAPVVNPILRGGEGESSLAVAGPIPGLVTYSGRIGFSGSTSVRSDSSTTSTRSFAFPILQNEWNTSPVRMVKADRKVLRKHHRGRRHGFLCFRF